jgi:hypothetical protein
MSEGISFYPAWLHGIMSLEKLYNDYEKKLYGHGNKGIIYVLVTQKNNLGIF